VPPLGLGRSDGTGGGTTSDLSDAVQLFAERGASTDPSFRLTAETAAVVVQICQRLDGLPLAIELAAARLRSFSPAEIAARLDDRFRLLTGGTRTSLPRQHTLQAAVDWSYELLSETEQKVFDRLSVFADGFTMDAAEAVCGEIAVDAVDSVIRLVEQSMVVAGPGVVAGTRYRLLETLRQYGWQRLAERGEDVEIRSRHAEFFLRIADEARPHLHGPDQGDWTRRLVAEYENARAAFDWCRTAGQVQMHLRLAERWGAFWIGSGYWTEARRRLDEALDLEAGKYPELRMRAILGSAQVFVAEDRDRAVALAEEALGLAERYGDSETMVRALILSGYTAKHRNEGERGLLLLERAIDLCREGGLEYERAQALVTLGNLASDHESERARSYLEAGLALHRELQNSSGVGQALHYLGGVAARSGDFDDAVAWLEEGLRVDAEIGGRDNSGHLLMELGNVRRLQGDTVGATELFGRSLEFLTDVGDENCAARTRTRLGLLALAEGSLTDASDHLGSSLVASARIGDNNVVVALEGLASLAVATGDPDKGVIVFSAAEGIRNQRGLTTSALDLARRDRDLDAARHRLGAAASEAAWERGAAMSLDDATSVALGTQSTQERS
jgi:tetratricopeptide (TPR) repeat protein